MIPNINLKNIYIKEINLKRTNKGVFTVCKYVENGVEKSVKDNERALPQLYEILNYLRFTGVRNLSFPDYYSDRILITGAKFKYKKEYLEECKLLGLYKPPTSLPIEINFYPWIYQVGEYGYWENDIKLLDALQVQAKLYAKGIREQMPLYQIEGEQDEQ